MNKIVWKNYEEAGITLLSLILTVVIMIILAGVTINVTLGDGGLINQAKHATEQTANATKSEQEQIDDLVSQLNSILAEDSEIPAPNPPIPDGTITIGNPVWAGDGTASVTVSSSASGYTIEYQINGTSEGGWVAVSNGCISGLKHGDTVNVRITDGDKTSQVQSKQINDTTNPGNASIMFNKTELIVGEALTATVDHVDNESGVNISQSKWVFNTSSSNIGTDDGSYTGTFTSDGEHITLNSNTAGEFYLHVLTVDVAGNRTETVSSEITISGITGTVTQSGAVTWSGGHASISLATTEDQYTIVYKINDAGSWRTYNGTIITGLSHGDTVTACLTNASQTTYGPEAEFEIQDTVAPTVIVNAQGSPSTNSITVTAVASDNESGMVASPTYTFQIKQSSQESYTTPSGAENITSATYTFTGLTQSTTYDIQVIVNGDVAGNTGTGTTQATTDTVPGADAGLETGNITASPATWQDGKASTTLTAHVTGFKIQYQVNGTSESGWSVAANSPVTVSNLNHNDTVYARLWDGNNGGSYAAINILDGTDPTVSVTVGTITETSIAVSVSASDGQSGLATSGTYKYYLNNDLKQTTENTSYTYEGLTGGTQYTIKVETVDKAGRTGSDTKEATTEVPSIPENTSYVGNYADVDGNGTVDGVIYADLAVGGSGRWTDIDGTYTIPKESNFKKYEVTQESYTPEGSVSGFGTGKVIVQVDLNSSGGTERFYVMALSDVDSSRHQFWSASTSVVTSTDFGTGESNTAVMKAKGSTEMWGISEVRNGTWNGSSGWYVPSKGEWSAFGDLLGITSSNYPSYGLSDAYWSSSQHDTYYAWSAGFNNGYMGYRDVYDNYYVRLGTTF